MYLQGETELWMRHFWRTAQRHQQEEQAFALLRREPAGIAHNVHLQYPDLDDHVRRLASSTLVHRDAELLRMPLALRPLACRHAFCPLSKDGSMSPLIVSPSDAPHVTRHLLAQLPPPPQPRRSRAVHAAETSRLPPLNVLSLFLVMRHDTLIPRQVEAAMFRRAAAWAKAVKTGWLPRRVMLMYCSVIRRGRSALPASAIIARHLAYLQQADLVSLVLARVQLRDAGLKALLEPLTQHTALTSLDLSSNCLGLQSAEHLAWLVRRLPRLRLLDISNSWHLGLPADTEEPCDAASRVLPEALSAAPALVALRCGHACIASWPPFLRRLTSPRLRQLALQGVRFAAPSQAQALSHLTQLTALNLRSAGIYAADAHALAPVLRALSSLRSLSLEGALKFEAVAILAPGLSAAKWLTHLSLADARQLSAPTLLAWVSGRTALESLCLSRNDTRLAFDDRDWWAALREVSSLQRLDLTGSCIGADAAAALAPCHAVLTQLTELRLASCALGAAGVRALAPMLQALPALQMLTLCDNKVNDDAAEHLGRCLTARALAGRRPISEIGLSRNEVSDAGQQGLRDACKRSSIQGCSIHFSSAQASLAVLRAVGADDFLC